MFLFEKSMANVLRTPRVTKNHLPVNFFQMFFFEQGAKSVFSSKIFSFAFSRREMANFTTDIVIIYVNNNPKTFDACWRLKLLSLVLETDAISSNRRDISWHQFV